MDSRLPSLVLQSAFALHLAPVSDINNILGGDALIIFLLLILAHGPQGPSACLCVSKLLKLVVSVIRSQSREAELPCVLNTKGI